MGAGAGSYEPRNRAVVALELSPTMIAQRSPSAAQAVCGSAMQLPFADGAFDAALAILTLHHWPDQARGLAEMRRVARKRCVILTWVPDCEFWLTRDYFPEILERDRTVFSLKPFRQAFGHFETRPVPVPHDCTDGFLCAYWRRPEAYLDPGVRGAISSFASVPDAAGRLERLRSDIADGTWKARNHALACTEADLGYRLVVAELGG